MKDQLFKDPLLRPADFYLDMLNLDTDFKTWLKEITTEEDISQDDFDKIKQYIEYIQQQGGRYHKKLLFLFSNPEQLPCFDHDVLHYHRINAIPDLFYKDGEPFHDFVGKILPDIKKYVEANADFRKKYERAKREHKKKSSVARRMARYLNPHYPLELIAELEGIPLDILKPELLPFLYWGNDVYQAAYNAIDGDINYDAIPRWSKDDNAWLPFLGLAAQKKDTAMAERIFENVDTAAAIRILVDIFYNRENEYKYGQINWLTIAIRNDFFSDDPFSWQGLYNRLEINLEDTCRALLFFKLIGNKVKRDDSKQAIEAIQLFFPNLVNDNTDRIVSNYVSYIFRLKIPVRDYQRFIKIIAKKAASYPPGTFLNWQIFKNYAGGEIILKMVLDFMIEYIIYARFDSKENILLLGQFLYNVIDSQSSSNLGIVDSLPEYVGFDTLLLPYIDDTEFALRLFTIPGTFEIKHSSEYVWLNRFFTLWFLHNQAEYPAAPVWPLDSNSYQNESTVKAAALILTPSVIIRADPEILDIIWRYFKIPDRNFFQDDFIPYKYFIRVNTDPEKDSALLETAANSPRFNRIELKVIRYIKLHGGFDFVDFSLNYNSIDDIMGFSPDIFVHHNIEKLALCLLYLKEKGDSFEKAEKIIRSIANKPPPAVETSEHLGFFIDEAVNEKDGEFFKLYKFTALYCHINFDIQRLRKDMPHEMELMLDRCRKHLAMQRRIEIDGLSMDETKYYYETSINAAWIIAKTVSCWKGIKPLLLAFRNTRRILLDERLYPHIAEENTADAIFRLLNHKWDDEKAKQLRRDMADEFCAYLKPLPEKDRGDPKDRERNYAETERNLAGFDIAYREPNPIWRYAYARSLADLGVDVDGKGHFFHSILEKAAEHDPSPAVREAAGKTAKYLRKLRDGWEEGSHKRHLIQAFWWLRRAHVLTIDERQYNEQEAVKARTSEFR